MRGAPGLFGQPDHILEAQDRHQRRRFHQPQPVVVDARDREAQHLRQHHPAEHRPGSHPVGLRGFGLPAIDSQKGAAKSLGVIGAENKTNRQHAGDKSIEAYRPQPHQTQQQVNQHLAAEKQQQHNYQLRDPAYQRGVGGGKQAQPRRAEELNQRVNQPQQQSDQ